MPTRAHRCATKPLLAAMSTLLLAAQTPLLACPALDRDAAVALTNTTRARGAACVAGAAAAPLRWSATLEQAALEQARWLATQDTLLHTGPQGQALAERARAAGYRFARISENLGHGHASLAQVLQGWTDSPTHCTNLYDPRITEMALACVSGAAGRPLWVMLQGRPL